MHRRICSTGTLDVRHPITFGIIQTLRIVAAIIILSSVSVFGQSTGDQDDGSAYPVTYGIESDFNSRYVWHGLAFSPAGVMQSCAWGGMAGFTGSVWSNYDLAAEIEGPRFNEVDFSLAYAASYGAMGLETSVQTYLYPDQPESPSTTELSFDLSWSTGRLQPFVIYTFDIDEYRGASFGEAGLRSAWEASGTVSVEATAGIGWGSARFNETYIGADQSALNLASAEAALTWSCTNAIYIRPHLQMTRLLDDDLRNLVDTPSIFQIGIAIGGEF